MANPQVNILAGTQPDYLAGLLPPEAWGMGFMARMIMVYSGEAQRVPLFGDKIAVPNSMLREDLTKICDLYGEMQWTAEAAETIGEWHMQGCPPAPTHSKLKHYSTRRILHTLKLCIISSASRGGTMLIDMIDLQRAQAWLTAAEDLMPEIFKDMSGKSDKQLIEDLHYYMVDCNKGDYTKGLHVSRLHMFLSARTPSWNAQHIIDGMIRSKQIINCGPDLYSPALLLYPGMEE